MANGRVVRVVSPHFSAARILIVDDSPSNVELLEHILHEADCSHIKSVTDPRLVLATFLEFRPDLILLDVMMPHLDGFAVMTQLHPRIPPDSFLPIVMLTADLSPEVRLRALANGAADFLTKPFNASEILLRIANLLSTRALQLQLVQQKQELEQIVQERTRAIEDGHAEILERLALASELRGWSKFRGGIQVGDLAAAMAKGLGLPDSEVEYIRMAAPLHDLGKILIPDSILLKPDQLTPEEYEVIKQHTVLGARMLSGSRSRLLQVAEEIALTHHEHWDGNGYTPGFAGEVIPLAGRIVAVVDAFDAMLSDRPYRPTLDPATAISEIERLSGTKFDPKVVRVFLDVIRESEFSYSTKVATARVETALATSTSPSTPASPVPTPTSSVKVQPVGMIHEQLTPRETEILELVADGLTNRDIAARLYLSEATVKTHVSRVLQKMSMSDRTKAAVYFHRQRL